MTPSFLVPPRDSNNAPLPSSTSHRQTQARKLPQTLNYAGGGIFVSGLPDQSHPDRPVTSRMAGDEKLATQGRPLTDKKTTLADHVKGSVSVDPQNGPAPPPGAPAVAALGDMNLGEGSATPAWVAYDGQSLSYGAYFTEKALDGRDRHRQCVIRFHLEDGTVDVHENKTDNSGIVQGRILKRHAAVGASGTPLAIADFQIGRPVTIYGRVYNVVCADAFTRDFLQTEGIAVAPDQPFPPTLVDEGPGVLGTIGMGVRGVGGQRVFAADPVEVVIGSSASSDPAEPARDPFTKDVLSFKCSWDDSVQGIVHYTLNYFLADGTVEVLEEEAPGRDPFPKMLARSKLPAGGAFAVGPPGEKNVTFLKPSDVVMGKPIGVYGRNLTVHDCDDFTRAYYVKVLGRTILEMAPKPLDGGAMKRTVVDPPPNGFGSDVDSLRNCHSLVPKRGPTDLRHFEKNFGKELRFNAAFAGPGLVSPNDERRFIVTYYLVDGTIGVYEPPMSNSGIIGGKFLERTLEPVKKPGARAPYVARDFHVGATVTLNSHRFELLNTDESTEKIIRSL